MNKLKLDKQETVIRALVEGCSVRSTERMTGVHRDTILRLMVRVGESCEGILDNTMRGLTCERIEVDEVWAYVGKKQRYVELADDIDRVGDFWTWVAFDPETKLVPTYHVGKRTAYDAWAFIGDLSERLLNRVQISSDGFRAYIEAIEAGFGANVDYAQIVKSYEAEPLGPGRYSPPKVSAVDKKRIVGNPDMDRVSTSYVERNNLTMRMAMRRFTRLTNAFSKKVENLKAAVALHFAYYNLVRSHTSVLVTPAEAAGVTRRPWTLRELVELSN